VDSHAVAAEYARKYGATILFHYESALRGYAARLSAAARAAIEQDPRVLAVEEDTEVRAMPGKPPRGPAPRPVMPD